ncbi:MAG: hypothetical protein AB9834_09970 [Lentimicrobium sp.]
MKKPEIKTNSKLTNLEVLQLYSDLKALKSVPGIKLNYAISRTIRSLKPLAEAFTTEQMIPKSTGFLQYEEALTKAYSDISARGGKGPKTRIVQTPAGEYETFDIDINADDVKEARAALQEEHSAAIADRKQDVKDYNEWLMLACEEEFHLHKIALSEIPQFDTIDYKSLWDACALLIEDES